MQNTSLGQKGTQKQLHNVSESMRDTAENLASDFSNRANRMARDSAEAAGEYYEKASGWLQQNYGKALGVVGLLSAVGVLGYFIGKNNNRSDLLSQSQR